MEFLQAVIAGLIGGGIGYALTTLSLRLFGPVVTIILICSAVLGIVYTGDAHAADTVTAPVGYSAGEVAVYVLASILATLWILALAFCLWRGSHRQTVAVFMIWFVWVLLCPTVVYIITSFINWDWWDLAAAEASHRAAFFMGTVATMGISFWAPLITKEHFYGY